MSQKVWLDGELVDDTLGLSLDDLRELRRWKRMTMDCPFCLLRITLDRFATFKQGTKKYAKKLSRKTMECPECHQRMRLKTLRECTNQTVEEFAFSFWENAFLFRGMERVSGDSFFARIKLWRYEDRQIFWNTYHKFKRAKDPREVEQDEDDYADYVRSHERKGLKE